MMEHAVKPRSVDGAWILLCSLYVVLTATRFFLWKRLSHIQPHQLISYV
jgi:hypothetical protein